MYTRLGIDLSAAGAVLAEVRPYGNKLQLHGFAVLDGDGNLQAFAKELGRARRQFHFPRAAEVIAWPGDPRVAAVRRAGFRVERVIPPGEALARVARMHHPVPVPGALSAVVSLQASSGALALVRDGALVHEAALTWPALGQSCGVRSELLRRYSFLAEVTESLRGAFRAAAPGQGISSLAEILTCGSLPELRSFTMPLAEEFDVEVETLDEVGAIEVVARGSSADQIRDRIAALQLAIAAASRPGPRRSLTKRAVRFAVPAGLAAAVLYALVQPAWRGADAARVKPAPAPKAASPARLEAGALASLPVRAAATPVAAVEPPPLSPSRPPHPQFTRPERAQRAASSTPDQHAAAAAGAVATVRLAEPARRPTRAEAPPVEPEPVPRVERIESADPNVPVARHEPVEPFGPMEPIERIAPVFTPSRPVYRPRPSSEPQPMLAAPFTVTSILWSAERQLALIDGRIVAVGDTVDGSVIVEIQQDGVIVRDSRGRLRRAALGRAPGEVPQG